MKKILIAIAAVILVGGVIFASSSHPGNNKNTTDQTLAVSTATITYDGNSFSPSSIKIKAGGVITFINKSKDIVDPASDPHPTHSDNPELNVGAINPGEGRSITVNHVGAWGMHNHLDESQRIRITIVK